MPANKKAAPVGSKDGLDNKKYALNHSTGNGGGNPLPAPGNLLALHFEFQGEPIPAARVRATKSGHVYTPAKYATYKSALITALKNQFGDSIPTPPSPGSKQRSPWLATHRYRLIVEIYRSVNRGDADNFLKTVQDAIQQAGLIGDDSQLDEVYCRKHIDKDNPRMAFVLEELAQKGGNGHGEIA